MVLDLDSVRLFVLTCDLGGLTRAAEAAGTVQPVVSQRLKALEARLGRQLLVRTPRLVRPTAEGEVFLLRARALLAAHEAALALAPAPAPRLRLGFSEHAIGLGLEAVLARLHQGLAATAPGTALALRTGLSLDLKAAFEAGEHDAVVLRREVGGTEGEVLGRDRLGWRAAPGFVAPPGAPLPLATLGALCGVRQAATRALEAARRPWVEACIAGGVAALAAAARAGLGVAPMGERASGSMPDCGPALGLPPLPETEVVLLARATEPALAAPLRVVAAALRGHLG